MGVTTTNNKPFNPRGNDQSPKGYNRAALYSGKALDFDGVNDSVEVADNDNLDFATNFSVVHLVKLSALQTSRVFYCNYAGGRGAATGISDSTNNVVKFFTRGSNSADTLLSSFALNTNEWYHILTTYDGATKKIYINGELDASVGYTDSITYTNATPRVGALSGGSLQFFNGEISNVKVFNTALTAAQVADLYNNPEKVVPTGVDNTALKLWLPMMEGAGTTAYDGSGNGNHGTISGATYVNGIGAPVAQSAVMDWNKGTNLLKYSEQIDNAAYTKSGGLGYSVVVTANHGTSPDGTQTADRVQITRGTTYAELFQRTTTSMVAGEDYVLSFYAKSLSGTPTLYTAWNDDYLNEVTFTTDWVRYEYQYQYISHIQGSGFNLVTWTSLPTTSTTADLLIWGVQLEKASSLGAYIPNHTNTAITSEVLLPQGLTTGRDITGVNLFENVRKQGALNLDGNSWAEVHDNESLDITDAITLEAWVYFDSNNSNKGLLGKWYTSSSNRAWLIYQVNATQLRFIISDNGTNTNAISSNALSEGWNHFIGVDDGTNIKVYSNGSLDSTGASYGSLYEVNKSLQIGIWNSETIKQFPNQIAQPRIYNRALTAEEVQRNYNAGKNTYTN